MEAHRNAMRYIGSCDRKLIGTRWQKCIGSELERDGNRHAVGKSHRNAAGKCHRNVVGKPHQNLQQDRCQAIIEKPANTLENLLLAGIEISTSDHRKPSNT